MIIFTIIGVLVYWMFCFELGRAIALGFDAKRGLDTLLKPVGNEMQAILYQLAKFQTIRAGARPTPQPDGSQT